MFGIRNFNIFVTHLKVCVMRDTPRVSDYKAESRRCPGWTHCAWLVGIAQEPRDVGILRLVSGTGLQARRELNGRKDRDGKRSEVLCLPLVLAQVLNPSITEPLLPADALSLS